MHKIFKSYDDEHEIEIVVEDNDIIWFTINKFNFKYYKTFLLMFKECVEYLNDNNIKIIKQYVNKDDIEYFKNSTCIEYSLNVFIISTPINKFTIDMINVLGLQII